MIKLINRQLLPEIKKVEDMGRKEYLRYYIHVLEENISEAEKVLKEKKKELKELGRS